MERRRGRPPKPPEESKAARINLRAGADEKTLYEQAAHAVGLDLSEWMRTRLAAAAKRDLRRSGNA